MVLCNAVALFFLTTVSRVRLFSHPFLSVFFRGHTICFCLFFLISISHTVLSLVSSNDILLPLLWLYWMFLFLPMCFVISHHFPKCSQNVIIYLVYSRSYFVNYFSQTNPPHYHTSKSVFCVFFFSMKKKQHFVQQYPPPNFLNVFSDFLFLQWFFRCAR